MSEEIVRSLSEKAGINRPFVFSSWIFMKAMGKSKIDAASELGTHRNTLTRYENRAYDALEFDEYARLVTACVLTEFRERVGELERSEDWARQVNRK